MSDWMEAVQAELQPLIKAPKLTEKLLKKPPFRFLHDIISNFVKSTQFPKDYFTADELDSSKVTDKQAKIDFLGKTITILEAGLKITCNAKPQIIVTGAEPENTADMLVKLAHFDKLSDAQKNAAAKGEDPSPPPKEKEKEAEPKKTSPAAEKPVKSPTTEKPAKEKKPAAAEKQEKPEKQQTPPTQQPSSSSSNVPAVAPIVPQDQPDQGARPGTATARKAPPKHENNMRQADQIQNEKVAEQGKSAGVIKEAGKDDESGKERDWQEVVAEEEQQAQRVREAESKGAAVGYLGKQAADAIKEQELKKEKEKQLAEAEGRNTAGIVLSTKRRGEKAAAGGMGESEMAKLREQLQLLTKATNPLGKFLEAIHEDIDTMSRELEMWRAEARLQSTNAQEAQRQTEQSLHEVHGKLQNLEDQVGDQMTKINLTRKSILDNDNTVETLLKMVVNPEVGGKRSKN